MGVAACSACDAGAQCWGACVCEGQTLLGPSHVSDDQQRLRALEHARQGKGPVLIEAFTYRVGALYKYELCGPDWTVLPAKADPVARLHRVHDATTVSLG